MPDSTPSVSIVDGDLHIRDVIISDHAVIDVIAGQAPEDRERVIRDLLAVGARGIVAMGVGLRLDEMDARVRATVDDALTSASGEVADLMDEVRAVVTAQLDPALKTSMMGATLEQIEELRRGFAGALDVDRASSMTSQLLTRLKGLVGPGGEMEERLRSALDQDSEGSPLARLGDMVEKRFDELRDVVVGASARSEVVDRSPSKGIDFEDVIEGRLRQIAAGLGGAHVERTSQMAGSLRSDAKVGDFVLELADGHRIVVEAKKTAKIAVGGRGGMLAELDQAIANRDCHGAICVSAESAFSDEVGAFGVFGKRVLCVDDGLGTLLGVAIRVLAALLVAESSRAATFDAAAVADRVQRIHGLASRFSTAKATLTKVGNSVADVQGILDDLRIDLLEQSAALTAELDKTPRAADELVPRLRSA